MKAMNTKLLNLILLTLALSHLKALAHIRSENFVGTFEVSRKYNLISFSPNKKYSIENLLKLTNMNIKYLKKFSCKGDARLELFSSDAVSINDYNTLKVLSKGNLYEFKTGDLYLKNNRVPLAQLDEFAKSALENLVRLNNTAVGSKLLKKLVASKHKIIIKKGVNRFAPMRRGEGANFRINEASLISNLDDRRPIVEGLPTQVLGSGGYVLWSSKIKMNTIEDDNRRRPISPVISLGHELYHAYDSVRGLLDNRFVDSSELEFQQVSEYRAVRFENSLRSELGMRYRKFYAGPSKYSISDSLSGDTDINKRSLPSMLDKDGNPVIMPAPCIGWI